MTKARLIKSAIERHYRYNEKYYPPQAGDIIKHLEANRIDNNAEAPAKHSGFDKAFDGSLAVFYYDDNSGLSVSTSEIIAIGN